MKFHLAVFFALLVGCVGRGRPAQVIETAPEPPAQRIVCMSSSHVAFLSELGLQDRIVGISGAGLITDPQVVARYAAGDIVDVGYDQNIDYEAVSVLGADLILLSGPDYERLERLGVRTLRVEDWTETTPLGRAGWIVEIAEACGVGEEGKKKFAEIARAYDEQKARAAELANGSVGARKPRVMLNAPYRDVWFVPGEENYMVGLVEDAGGTVVAAGGGAQSSPVDLEDAYVAMRGADFWLNPNHYTSVAALLADNPRLADTPPVVNGRVFNNNARTTEKGGSDFWESGVVRPDLVLRDLVTILHGSDSDAGGDTLYYYRKLN